MFDVGAVFLPDGDVWHCCILPCYLALIESLCPRLDEASDELRDLIGGGIEREMTRVEDVDLGLWHIAAISLGLRKLERQVVLAPENEKPRLLLAHPGLPLGVGIDVRAVIVEEIALNVGLAGLAEKGELIRPEIRVIPFHAGV